MSDETVFALLLRAIDLTSSEPLLCLATAPAATKTTPSSGRAGLAGFGEWRAGEGSALALA